MFIKYKSIRLFLILLITSCATEVNYLPESISGLRLEKKVTHEEAKQLVNRLHFSSVASEKNEIGSYLGINNSATVFISYFHDQNNAYDAFKKMTQKISPNNSVFSRFSYHRVMGKQVYNCFGLGQTHYVFSHNNVLFWISADTTVGKNFLEEYLEKII